MLDSLRNLLSLTQTWLHIYWPYHVHTCKEEHIHKDRLMGYCVQQYVWGVLQVPSIKNESISSWNKVRINLTKLSVSSRGNHDCITLTNYFSKWAESIPASADKGGQSCYWFPDKMLFHHEEILFQIRAESSVIRSSTGWKSSRAFSIEWWVHIIYSPMDWIKGWINPSRGHCRSWSMRTKRIGISYLSLQCSHCLSYKQTCFD